MSSSLQSDTFDIDHLPSSTNQVPATTQKKLKATASGKSSPPSSPQRNAPNNSAPISPNKRDGALSPVSQMSTASQSSSHRRKRYARPNDYYLNPTKYPDFGDASKASNNTVGQQQKSQKANTPSQKGNLKNNQKSFDSNAADVIQVTPTSKQRSVLRPRPTFSEDCNDIDDGDTNNAIVMQKRNATTPKNNKNNSKKNGAHSTASSSNFPSSKLQKSGGSRLIRTLSKRISSVAQKAGRRTKRSMNPDDYQSSAEKEKSKKKSQHQRNVDVEDDENVYYNMDHSEKDHSSSDSDSSRGRGLEMKITETQRTRVSRRLAHGPSFKRPPAIPIRRYRGFSTSISALFEDETILCGAISCFGLLLSSRTEHLLQQRNQRRGVTAERTPSYILSVALLIVIILVSMSYLVFGNGMVEGSREISYYWDDDEYIQRNDGYSSGRSSGHYSSSRSGHSSSSRSSSTTTSSKSKSSGNTSSRGGLSWFHHRTYTTDESDSDDNNDDKVDIHGMSNRNGYYKNDHGYLRSLASQEQRIGEKPKLHWKGIGNGFFDIRKSRIRGCNIASLSIHDLSIFYHPQQQNRDENDFNKYRLLSDNDDYYDGMNGYDGTSASTTAAHTGKNIRSILAISFLLLLGLVGRKRRMETRYTILKARAHDDHLNLGVGMRKKNGEKKSRISGSGGIVGDTREGAYEGVCSHALCGCYPSDQLFDEIEELTDIEIKEYEAEDCCARANRCITSACFGSFPCSMWCQCLSVCALAQEARETKRLVPPSTQLLDYITHEPFRDYEYGLNVLRRTEERRLSYHYEKMSRLSKSIWWAFGICTLIISATLMLWDTLSFGFWNAVVLLCTFGQSFGTLFFVHWLFNKSHLSLDAVTKFFAVGFVLAVPVAFVLEGILVNVFLVLMGIWYELCILFKINVLGFLEQNEETVVILGEVVNAFFVAAMVEELCKYYAFRFLEHPDLVFLMSDDHDCNKKKIIDGREMDIRRSNSTSSDSTYEFCEDHRTMNQKASAVTVAMISVAVGLACAENFMYVFILGGSQYDAAGEALSSAWHELFVLILRGVFPIHALAAAMQSISVIKRFLEDGYTNPMSDNWCSAYRLNRFWCAGSDAVIGVGMIVFPSIIMHGTFDGILMAISVVAEYRQIVNEYYDGDDDAGRQNYLNNMNGEDGVDIESMIMTFLGIFVASSVIAIGFFWFRWQSSMQRDRLDHLEMVAASAAAAAVVNGRSNTNGKGGDYGAGSLHSPVSTLSSKETQEKESGATSAIGGTDEGMAYNCSKLEII